jgi:hypothetical protein
VGFVLASRRPGNRVGWIFLGVGLVLGLGFFSDWYGRSGLVAAPGSLPAARAAAWFENWATVIPAASLASAALSTLKWPRRAVGTGTRPRLDVDQRGVTG